MSKRRKTYLCSGELVAKTSDQIETSGHVDAFMTVLGIAKNIALDDNNNPQNIIANELEYIQRILFIVGSECVCNPNNVKILPTTINKDHVVELGQKSIKVKRSIKKPTDFILPGNNKFSVNLDMCRVYCRTLERSIVNLYDKNLMNNTNLLTWINRLSEYLYLLARSTENNNYNLR